MKMGEFARETGLTIDTIRHYIDIGLITPEKTGAHYRFTVQCEEDAHEIVWLKEHGFSLEEIKGLLLYKRITNLNTQEDRDIYRGMILEKQKSLEKEKERLERIIDELNSSNENADGEAISYRLGLPMTFLRLSACPACGGKLRLDAAQVENDMILNGKLLCRCGYLSEIIEGILVQKVDFTPCAALNYAETAREYQQSTDSAFINLMYSANEWVIGRSKNGLAPECVILEPGTGGGILLRHILSSIPESALYIAVDHDYKTLKYTKEQIQKSHIHANIAFLCCEFTEMPLKNESADILFDIYGSSGYNIHHDGFLLNIIGEKAKTGAFCAGTLFCFDRNSRTLCNLPKEKARFFIKEEMEKHLWRSPFTVSECVDIGYSDKAGPSEPFFAEGDKIYVKAYTGVKK